MKDMVAEKSYAILALQRAKEAGESRRSLQELASRAATLETRLAEQFLEEERGSEAAISFLSAASCMKDARRYAEACRLLDRALVYANAPELSRFLESEREAVAVQRKPAEVFRRAPYKIRENKLLRIPQREAYMAARLHFTNSSEHAIIQLPVGCGKTGTMAILPFGIASGRALVVAPNLEIRDTLARSLDYTSPTSFYHNAKVLTNGYGPTVAILDADATLVDADQSDFVVSNIQQLGGTAAGKWLDNLPPDYFDFILVDEGHHNVAISWRELFDHFPRARVTSFTATPFRSDGKEVEGRRIYHYPISDAIREGYVRDLASRRLEPEEIYFEYKGSRHRHSLEEILELREEDWFSRGVALSSTCNEHIVNASIQCMRELREGGNAKHQIIAVACSIDHAKSIRSLYTERGLDADVLHSQLDASELSHVRRQLTNGSLDAIIQVQMLGEGADYPTLGVAAIFRPFRHLVPYVQFIGRVMRVIRQNAPGHPDNRGYVVSHVGLNVERWWNDLRRLDEGDKLFYEQLYESERDFQIESRVSDEPRRYRAPMQVLQEVVERFVEVGFMAQVREAVVEDVVQALALRGVDLETLGVSREELVKRIEAQLATERIGEVSMVQVQPQRRRQEARRRLNERVRSAASEVIRVLGMHIGGYDLPRLFPNTGSVNNVGAANVLLNREIQRHLRASSAERDLLSLEELEDSYRRMDDFVDAVVGLVREAQT